jgi:hypothetical protein
MRCMMALATGATVMVEHWVHVLIVSQNFCTTDWNFLNVREIVLSVVMHQLIAFRPNIVITRLASQQHLSSTAHHIKVPPAFPNKLEGPTNAKVNKAVCRHEPELEAVRLNKKTDTSQPSPSWRARDQVSEDRSKIIHGQELSMYT